MSGGEPDESALILSASERRATTSAARASSASVASQKGHALCGALAQKGGPFTAEPASTQRPDGTCTTRPLAASKRIAADASAHATVTTAEPFAAPAAPTQRPGASAEEMDVGETAQSSFLPFVPLMHFHVWMVPPGVACDATTSMQRSCAPAMKRRVPFEESVHV